MFGKALPGWSWDVDFFAILDEELRDCCDIEACYNPDEVSAIGMRRKGESTNVKGFFVSTCFPCP